MHLALTARPYLEAIDAAVEKARRRGRTSEGPYRRGALGRWFARTMEPPPRRSLPTLRRLVPPERPEVDEAHRALAEARDAFLASLRRAEGVDLGRAKLRSPFFPLLRFRASDAFHIVLAHNRRHLWHARRTVEAVRVSPSA